MKLKIEIELGNAAFKPSIYPEVIRILEEYAGKLENSGNICQNLMDINGNFVGETCLIRNRKKK
jgi:hypothetical protein